MTENRISISSQTKAAVAFCLGLVVVILVFAVGETSNSIVITGLVLFLFCAGTMFLLSRKNSHPFREWPSIVTLNAPVTALFLLSSLVDRAARSQSVLVPFAVVGTLLGAMIAQMRAARRMAE